MTSIQSSEKEQSRRPTVAQRESRPLFPLSPVDLERWQRFASKGGIGKARARADKVSQDGGQKDLMFLAGEEIVILLDLGNSAFLGCCEGVVGLLYRSDIDMLQRKLKKPVMTARPKRPSALQLSAPGTSSGQVESTQLHLSALRPPAPASAASQDWTSLASTTSLNAISPALSHSDPSRSASAHEASVAAKHPANEALKLSHVPTDRLSANSIDFRFVPARASSMPQDQHQFCEIRPPSHVLSPSGLPVPSLYEQPPSSFSFSPNSSIASSIPTSIFSAGGVSLRRSAREGSYATVQSFEDESGPSSAGDDPTLAFIFDSYKYSDAPVEAVHTTTQGDRFASLGAPVSSLVRGGSDASAPQALQPQTFSDLEAPNAGADSIGHNSSPALPPDHQTPRLNKLRRPRLESSPAPRPAVPTFAAPPSRNISLPRSSSMSTSSGSSRRRRSVDYSTGISNRDFAEETVQIGKSEFEMVKPLASLLLKRDKSSTSAGHLARCPNELTASSPRDGSAPNTAFPPASLVTPRPIRSAASTSSHFSPPTPPSAEIGGRTGLAKYRAREAKWLAALSTPSEARHSKKIRRLVVAGVPSSLRGRVWALLAQRGEPLPEGFYRQASQSNTTLPSEVEEELLAMENASDAGGVGKVGRRNLEGVLQAFRTFRPALSYYPGLGRVAGDLLGQMPAEAAFETLVSLVDGYRFRAFFPSQRAQLELEMLTFSFLLDRLEAKLATRLRNWGIEPQDYLPAWLSTLFTGILPDDSRLRAIDLLLFDPKNLYAIPLALLDLSNLGDTISFPSRDAALNHLLAPAPDAFNLDLLVQAVASTKVTDDKISKAREKAQRAIASGS